MTMSTVLSENNGPLVDRHKEHRGQAIVQDQAVERLGLVLSEHGLLPGEVSERQYEENRSYILKDRRHLVDSICIIDVSPW